jgi:hypothetical protein
MDWLDSRWRGSAPLFPPTDAQFHLDFAGWTAFYQLRRGGLGGFKPHEAASEWQAVEDWEGILARHELRAGIIEVPPTIITGGVVTPPGVPAPQEEKPSELGAAKKAASPWLWLGLAVVGVAVVLTVFSGDE